MLFNFFNFFRYPVILREFSLNYNTGGNGIFHGGDGVIREIQFRKPLTLSILSERRVYQPYGLKGNLVRTWLNEVAQ